MENSTSIAYKKENTTFKNELTSNQILDFASMLQLVLGCSIIMLNLFSTLILICSTKMMFSVRLPAINMSISYILLGIGLLVPDTLVFDRHYAISATRGKINMKCIKKVSLYTGCFVLFAFPYIISRFAHTMSPKPNLLLINLKELFARLIFVTPFLNPILYTILFTECRFQLLTFICFWNTKLLNKYKEKAKKNKCTYTIESISKSVNFR